MLIFIFKKFLIPILASIMVFVFFDHNAFLYKEPIAQITAVQNSKAVNLTDSLKNQDLEITQKLNLRLLNTSKSGSTLYLSNIAIRSQVSSQIYTEGQQVLLTKTKTGYQIFSLKRDAVVAALAILLIGLIFSFINWSFSIYLLLSLGFNLLLFLLTLFLDLKFSGLTLPLFLGLAIAFAASSLFFVLGRGRQYFLTLISTLGSTSLTFLFCLCLLSLTNFSGIHFENLNYVTQSPETFFFISASISVLGAIMDGCSDIVAGLMALQRQNPKISSRQYFKSGLLIGREITGTLTNVLFMIFMAECLPLTLLLIRNAYSWSSILQTAFNLGLLQSLISAIGILLSVPITAGLSSYFLQSRSHLKQKEAL
ncbi:MAG: YibE/F family protein [Streptococcaceae bacterium]|nr:YibE/F family protein [Streptococcaceae bacterium]